MYFGVVNIDAWESISWETKVAPPDVHVHPEFEWFYLSNDIALIEVKNAPLNLLEDLFVDTIALPYPLPDFDFTGWTGTVVSNFNFTLSQKGSLESIKQQFYDDF